MVKEKRVKYVLLTQFFATFSLAPSASESVLCVFPHCSAQILPGPWSSLGAKSTILELGGFCLLLKAVVAPIAPTHADIESAYITVHKGCEKSCTFFLNSRKLDSTGL